MDAVAAGNGRDDDEEGDEEAWPPKNYDPMAPLLLPLGPRSHAKQVEVRRALSEPPSPFRIAEPLLTHLPRSTILSSPPPTIPPTVALSIP